MLQISRDLSVESGPKVSEAGPGSVRVLRPNSGSDFQYQPVLDVRSVGSVPRSNPASTRPGSITDDDAPLNYPAQQQNTFCILDRDTYPNSIRTKSKAYIVLDTRGLSFLLYTIKSLHRFP